MTADQTVPVVLLVYIYFCVNEKQREMEHINSFLQGGHVAILSMARNNYKFCQIIFSEEQGSIPLFIENRHSCTPVVLNLHKGGYKQWAMRMPPGTHNKIFLKNLVLFQRFSLQA